MTRERSLVALVAALALLVIAAEAQAKEPLNIKIQMDEALNSGPEEIMSAWLHYAMARADWIRDHVKTDSPEFRSYTRSFDEELAGRNKLVISWAQLRAKNVSLSDRYLDQLEKVKDAGLLREYVWVNLIAANWHTPPPDLQLERYTQWATVNLKGHVVETHADVHIKVTGTR